MKNITKVIYFYSSACNQCKFLQEPVMEKLEKDYQSNSQVEFVKINIDEKIELAERLHIAHVPTIVVLGDSGKAEILAGPVTYNEINGLIIKSLS